MAVPCKPPEPGTIDVSAVFNLLIGCVSSQSTLEPNKTVQLRIIRAIENILLHVLNEEEQDVEDDSEIENNDRFAIPAADLHRFYQLLIHPDDAPFDRLLQVRCRLALLATFSRVLPLDAATLRVCVTITPTFVEVLTGRIKVACASVNTLADVYWQPGGVALFRTLDVLCAIVESVNEVIDDETVFADDASRDLSAIAGVAADAAAGIWVATPVFSPAAWIWRWWGLVCLWRML